MNTTPTDSKTHRRLIPAPPECPKCHGRGCRRRACDECTPRQLRFGHYCPACQSTGEVLVECAECEGQGLIRTDSFPRVSIFDH